MLVLSRRQNETLVFPGLETTIQVVSIKKGVVRLGIAAPKHVRVLRGELPDHDAEWADAPAAVPPGLPKLVEKRLAIVRRGLDEVQRSMSAARTEEAELLLDKLDEDLHLLRQRVHSESAACTCAGDDDGNCQCPADAPRSR